MEPYRLEFNAIGGELRIDVFGERRDPERTLEYWRKIAAESRRRGSAHLLVISHVPGDPMPVEQMRRFFMGMLGLGLEGARVAYVDTQGFKTPLMETAEILAGEYGFEARVFDSRTAAELWLRHGVA